MTNELIIREADQEDINTIGYLAHEVWPVAYKKILTPAQLHYMLELIYSPASLRRQMSVDKHHFVLAELDEDPVGFASFSKVAEPSTFKLHKLYVQTGIQGKGLGKTLLDHVMERVKELGATRLRLNVNRHNTARSFYEKMGFVIIKEEDVDIGNGYYMNDFVMEKKLSQESGVRSR